ncbi:MAG TPA: sigma-54 dependent transcriptional regulator [Nitrospiraceae bacterium]|nr:sigma-54 dependent transcriptional regulator [Nitrospiraceae bacterium]
MNIPRPRTVMTASDPNALALSVRASCLVFEDDKSKALLGLVHRIAPSNATALIIGETGTGKELIARHIHQVSDRQAGPFVAVNCAAISESLIESELFGHERGAFTGAVTARAGWFETAHGGTLFLDEIGDLPLPLQVKLLRVVQERQVVRVGSRQPAAVDVRLVAATNVDLKEAVAAGRFREDLYYRLNVAPVVLPPLRDRRGDILPLAYHFLSIYSERLGYTTVNLSSNAIERLLTYPWPGNIRELENTIHHALLVCPGTMVRAEDLHLPSVRHEERSASPAAQVTDPLSEALHRLFNTDRPGIYQFIDEMVIRTAYEYCDRNQLRTARLLGISRNVVRDRLSRYGLLHSRKEPDGAEPSRHIWAQRSTG